MSGYYGMVENLDFNLGRVMKTLQEEGIGFNTHVVFFSDHGDMLGSHGQFRKMTAHEESIRVPFFITGATPTYDGHMTGQHPVLINAPDIAPTTLGLCGIKKPSWMEGKDFSGVPSASGVETAGTSGFGLPADGRPHRPSQFGEQTVPRHRHTRRLEVRLLR